MNAQPVYISNFNLETMTIEIEKHTEINDHIELRRVANIYVTDHVALKKTIELLTEYLTLRTRDQPKPGCWPDRRCDNCTASEFQAKKLSLGYCRRKVPYGTGQNYGLVMQPVMREEVCEQHEFPAELEERQARDTAMERRQKSAFHKEAK